MKIIIEIDKETYNHMKERYMCDYANTELDKVGLAVKNSTPLPEKYGDLVDRDAINNRFNAICDELEALSNQPTHKELLDKLSICLDTAEPIIKNNYKEMEEELWT